MTRFASGYRPALYLSSPSGVCPGPRLEPGTSLERFTIVRHLGTGRAAHVYLAGDRERGQEVALKIADCPPNHAQEIEARMKRELDCRQVLGSHPHVLSLFDTYRIPLDGLQLRILSLEYADGGDFRQWLVHARTEPWTHRVAGLRCILDAARGLAALHRAGIVHFDVKPENFVCVQGIWKTGDLDLACRTTDLANTPPVSASDLTGLGVRGTEAYLSPEMARPGSGPVDTRADIYSLGLVLQETWGTRRIVGGDDLRPDVPDRQQVMQRILKRCLATDPQSRFQCVEQVVEALEAELNRDATDRSAPPWPKADRQWRRACHYLRKGRARDARRICERLMEAHPSHPGACEVLDELNHRTTHVLETSQALMADIDHMPLGDALVNARELLELLPDREHLGQLLDAMERRIGDCQATLINSLRHLAAGRWNPFADSLEEAAVQDPGHHPAAAASAAARDLVEHLERSRQAIGELVKQRLYHRSLRGTRRHRSRLAGLRQRADRLLSALETND